MNDREAIEIASTLLVTDITNDVGDPGIWLALVEPMPFALRDLYHQTSASQNKVPKRDIVMSWRRATAQTH